MNTSNLLLYTDAFFDMLEVFEDIERGHLYKLNLKDAVSRFLSDETHGNAFAVYRAFFDAYRVTMQGDGNPFLDIIGLLGEYEENAAGLTDKQRDHYIHSVNVFLTGLAVYAANSRYRAAFRSAVPEREYALAYRTKHEEFFYRWGLASLFHDIGYPVEIIGNQLDRFLRIVADADGEETRVRAKISFENFEELDHIRELGPAGRFSAPYAAAYPETAGLDLLSPLDILAHRIHCLLGCDLGVLRGARDGAVEDMARKGFVDHGFYSALILLKWYGFAMQQAGYRPEYFYWPVADSAAAILLHNWYRNALQKPPFLLGALRAEQAPVAFLLILCDELQEWNRAARGIVTRRYPLAGEVNLSLTDSYLSVTYLTARGSLPAGFCEDKSKLLASLLALAEIFPQGCDLDAVSAEGLDARGDLSADLPQPLFAHIERLAVAIHARYNELQLAQHPDRPLAYPRFSDLPESLQRSNLRQARGICAHLAFAGYALAEGEEHPRAVSRISEALVEVLAEREHEAWMAERLAAGWTKGPRDAERKTSPYLVPYADLSEEIKEYDRDAIRNIPRLARMVGMVVYEA